MFDIIKNLIIQNFNHLNESPQAYELIGIVIFGLIGFLGTFVFISLKPKYDEGFLTTFSIAIVSGILSLLCSMILYLFWTVILFCILPIIFLTFLCYKSKNIISWFKRNLKDNCKQSKNIIKDSINELKADELAKQAWETLKKDFPNIKYETVLESIKNRM